MLRSAMSTASQSFDSAVAKLSQLATNAATIMRAREASINLQEIQMSSNIDYLRRLGYSPSDLNALNVFHVTGTKGKGSTSAFCDSILRNLDPNLKVGLFTSPHLCSVCERIRINGKPIEEEKFARYFFQVWDGLEATADQLKYPEVDTVHPFYFKYLTLMAFHVFLQEKVDISIFEVGIGGTYDNTNIIPRPLTTGVSALGMDHVAILGPTIQHIAHQKGGIYKKGVPALSVAQSHNLEGELRARAKELHASSFTVVQPSPALENIKLGLAGKHQKSNASLAVALVQSARASPYFPKKFSHLALSPDGTKPIPQNDPETPASISSQESMDDSSTTTDTIEPLAHNLVSPQVLDPRIVKGLENARWPGRCQVIPARTFSGKLENVAFYLDGAHTVESLQCCGEWFADEMQLGQTSVPRSRTKRVLIFHCSWDREYANLLETIQTSVSCRTPDTEKDLPFFDYAIFSDKTTFKSGWKADLKPLANTPTPPKDSNKVLFKPEDALCKAWKEKVPCATTISCGSIEESLSYVQNEVVSQPDTDRVDVLVTGSLHLIGGVMVVLQVNPS